MTHSYKLLLMTCAAATALTLTTNAFAAETRYKLEPRYLPPKVSTHDAEAKLVRLKKLSAPIDRKLSQESAARVAKLQQIVAPVQADIRRVLAADPKLAREFASYEADAKKMKGETGEIEDFARKYEGLIETLFKNARIDEAKYRKLIEQDFQIDSGGQRGPGPRMMAMSKGKSRKINWGKFLNFQVYERYLPVQGQPSEQEFVISPPFPFTKERTTGSSSQISIDVESGTYRASAQAHFIGGMDTTAGLGHFFVMPGDWNQVKLSVAGPDTSFFAHAVGILGAGGADVKMRVDVLSENEIACRQDHVIASAFAPVAWVSMAQGTEPLVVTCTFDAPPAGEEIVLNVSSDSGAWAAVNAHSSASTSVKPRDIKVKLSR